MNLTNLLSAQNKRRTEFREVILKYIPGPEYFKALSKKPAADCDIIVPCYYDELDLRKASDKAFNVVASTLIATKTGMWEQLEKAILPTSRSEIRMKLKTVFSEEQDNIFVNNLTSLNRFVMQGCILVDNQMLNTCCYFARLYDAYKKDFTNVSKIFFETESKLVLDDVASLARIFVLAFLFNKVKASSRVMYSPKFPATSNGVGIIGDIYIDGFLLDFKTSDKYVYDVGHISQVFCRYLFNELNNMENIQNGLYTAPVSRIGLYYARYGETIYLDLSTLPDGQIEAALKAVIAYERMISCAS